jgi:hypothetical protein
VKHCAGRRLSGRLGLTVVVAGLALALPVAAAQADPVPDLLAPVGAPLAGATPQPLGTVVDDVTGAAPTLLDPARPPAPSAPSALPAPPALPTAPAPQPSSVPPRAAQGADRPPPQASTGAPSHVRAPAEDEVAALDAHVPSLLGACVRLTRAGVPAQATVQVLDRNLLDQLAAVGLPIDRLVVPCPRAGAEQAGAGSTVVTPPAPASAAPASAGPASAAPTGPLRTGRLAFTGAEPLSLAVLGVFLLAGGVVSSRASFSVVEARG